MFHSYTTEVSDDSDDEQTPTQSISSSQIIKPLPNNLANLSKSISLPTKSENPNLININITNTNNTPLAVQSILADLDLSDDLSAINISNGSSILPTPTQTGDSKVPSQSTTTGGRATLLQSTISSDNNFKLDKILSKYINTSRLSKSSSSGSDTLKNLSVSILTETTSNKYKSTVISSSANASPTVSEATKFRYTNNDSNISTLNPSVVPVVTKALSSPTSRSSSPGGLNRISGHYNRIDNDFAKKADTIVARTKQSSSITALASLPLRNNKTSINTGSSIHINTNNSSATIEAIEEIEKSESGEQNSSEKSDRHRNYESSQLTNSNENESIGTNNNTNNNATDEEQPEFAEEQLENHDQFYTRSNEHDWFLSSDYSKNKNNNNNNIYNSSIAKTNALELSKSEPNSRPRSRSHSRSFSDETERKLAVSTVLSNSKPYVKSQSITYSHTNNNSIKYSTNTSTKAHTSTTNNNSNTNNNNNSSSSSSSSSSFSNFHSEKLVSHIIPSFTEINTRTSEVDLIHRQGINCPSLLFEFTHSNSVEHRPYFRLYLPQTLATQQSTFLCCRKKTKQNKWRFSLNDNNMQKKNNPNYVGKMTIEHNNNTNNNVTEHNNNNNNIINNNSTIVTEECCTFLLSSRSNELLARISVFHKLGKKHSVRVQMVNKTYITNTVELSKQGLKFVGEYHSYVQPLLTLNIDNKLIQNNTDSPILTGIINNNHNNNPTSIRGRKILEVNKIISNNNIISSSSHSIHNIIVGPVEENSRYVIEFDYPLTIFLSFAIICALESYRSLVISGLK